ncbi:MAG: DUF4160 domain-containing protein [Opitutaceae bacterium]|nr:DUF4160 domain-containing protein [Opitutaceae bacterium]
MPPVLRIGCHRFHFYSNEGIEPAHVHVRSPNGECRLVFQNQSLLREKSHEYHRR